MSSSVRKEEHLVLFGAQDSSTVQAIILRSLRKVSAEIVGKISRILKHV